MELDEILPDGSDSWKISKGQLLYKKYIWLPAFVSAEDGNYVFLDRRMHKAIIKLVARLVDLGIDFSCVSPDFASPKGIDRWKQLNIEHCLRAYASKEFFRGFEKIGFDLIKNMVDWTEREGCYDSIKECYEKIRKEVCRSYYDYYSNKHVFDYEEEIRDAFDRIYREIQINRIL